MEGEWYPPITLSSSPVYEVCTRSICLSCIVVPTVECFSLRYQLLLNETLNGKPPKAARIKAQTEGPMLVINRRGDRSK
jgi:hypothetical protein